MRFETEILTSGAFAALARAVRRRGGTPFARGQDRARSPATCRSPAWASSIDDYAALASRVDIIINGAASVTFDAPIDEALLPQHAERRAHRGVRARLPLGGPRSCVHRLRRGATKRARLPRRRCHRSVGGGDRGDRRARRRACEREAAAGQWDAARRGPGSSRKGWRAPDVSAGTTATPTPKRSARWCSCAIAATCRRRSSGRRSSRAACAIRSPGWLENLNVGDPIWVEYGRGRMPDFPIGLDADLRLRAGRLRGQRACSRCCRASPTRADDRLLRGRLRRAQSADGRAQIYEITYDYFRAIRCTTGTGSRFRRRD